jgi:hypothetical protein
MIGFLVARKVFRMSCICCHAEVSYKGGFPVTYGTTGSVRADAIYGPIASPEIVFELKTSWGWVSTGESRAYFENIPRGRDPALSVIKVN